ncbi:MAG: hypothetical protein U0169_12095 [Polyangiaceae bacterium]
MNLLEARVVLRERPLLDVFDLSLRFVAWSAPAFGKLASITLLPSFLAAWAALAWNGPWLAWPVAFVGAVLSEPFFTVLASRLVFEPKARVRDVVKATLVRSLALSAVRAVQAVAIGLTSILFFVPGLWLSAILFFVVEATLLENAGPTKAIDRSRKIAGADMGDALLATFLLLGGHVAFVCATEFGGREVMETVLQSSPPRSLFERGASELALFGFLAYVPCFATVRFFVYLNLRTRSEGWDIQTRFTGIKARAEANA